MRIWRVAYWLITGALLGLGLVELPGLGLILFPVGVVLLIAGLLVARGRETVAGVLGFGALPAAAFVNAIVFLGSPLNSPFYLWGAIISGVITLAGLVALILVWRSGGSGPVSAAT